MSLAAFKESLELYFSLLVESAQYEPLATYRRGGAVMVQFRELDDRVPFAAQLGESGGPMVFMNVFHVAPEEVEEFMAAWTADGEFMKEQPGYISTQLHRGVAGSTTFINVAQWQSVEAFRAAAGNPEFQASLSRYPESAVASPHIFTKITVPGICGG